MENKTCLKPPTSIAEHVKCQDCVCFRRNMRIPAKKHHINLFHATSLVGTFPEFWVICQTSRWNRGRFAFFRNAAQLPPSQGPESTPGMSLESTGDKPDSSPPPHPAFFEFFWIYLGYAAQKHQVFTLNTFPFWPFGFGRLDDPKCDHMDGSQWKHFSLTQLKCPQGRLLNVAHPTGATWILIFNFSFSNFRSKKTPFFRSIFFATFRAKLLFVPCITLRYLHVGPSQVQSFYIALDANGEQNGESQFYWSSSHQNES